ncbi:AMP-binding protein [Cumulibacter soli]|uniref:AMP-binding protein n=1 Tax=Cumulibacter soli TaxID=2546344 RepID=UPI001ABB9709|nr:AMP-binding protein [Cumulibacter soli]
MQLLRPYVVQAVPTRADIAEVASVLGAPRDILLPVDAADRERVLAAARVTDPVIGDQEPLVLGVATTGSTGAPKIVLHTARSLRASADAAIEFLGGHGQWLLCLGINHIAGIQVVLRSALAGIDPVVCPAGGPSFVDQFTAATNQLTHARRYVSLVPTQLQRLIDGGALDALRSLSTILLGGAAADPGLLARARDAGVNVVTTYGASETAGGCVYDGIPLRGVEVDTTGGIVRLSGDVVASGYRDPVAQDPLDGRTFTTSDLGEISDGRLRVLGRADDIINTGGKKVSPLRIEQALRTLPGIDDAIVVGIPDLEWGQRAIALVSGPGCDEPREALRTLLAPHELPTQFLLLPELPYKGIGKPDRAQALRIALENA